jgi:Tol biopolymer transport system component
MRRRLAITIAVLVITALAAPSAQASFPGGNGKMVFDKDFTVWAVDADGVSNETQLVAPDDEGILGQARWSADGGSIVYRLSGPDDALIVADADGSDPTTVLEASVNDPAFSPDGQHIVFRASLDGQSLNFPDLYVVARSGGTPQRLTTDIDAAGPVWSPDGKTIAFNARPVFAEGNRIFTIDVTNLASPGLPVPRTDAGGSNENGPNWAPDGSRIFFRQNGATRGIDSINPDGTDRQPVVDFGPHVPVGGPFVSPDGTKVAYLDSSFVPKIANIDGTDPVDVSRIGDWQPIVTQPPPPAPVCPAVAPKGLVGPLVYGLGQALNLAALKQLACGLGGL